MKICRNRIAWTLLTLGVSFLGLVFLTACPRAEKSSETSGAVNSTENTPIVQAQAHGEQESGANTLAENESQTHEEHDNHAESGENEEHEDADIHEHHHGTAIPEELKSVKADVRFRLRTHTGDELYSFIGDDGKIKGLPNPTLNVKLGDVVEVVLINKDGTEHDISFPDFGIHSDHVKEKGETTVVRFRADKEGKFPYFCTIPGHREYRMNGELVVKK